MDLVIVGLGRMGGNIARRLMKHGHFVAGHLVIDDWLAKHRIGTSFNAMIERIAFAAGIDTECAAGETIAGVGEGYSDCVAH